MVPSDLIDENSIRQRLLETLRSRYGVPESAARFARAPYRVCPLGAHIDHQLGVVTALALDRALTLAYAPARDATVRLTSLAFSGEVAFDLRAIPAPAAGDWGNYARGAAWALSERGPLARGIVGVVHGEFAEMGVSSSAALGIACLLALEEVNEMAASPAENIRLDQRIENGYLGLRNGILDQTAILCSRRDHLTVIDCRAFASANSADRDSAGVAQDLPPGVSRAPLPPGAPPVGILIAFSGLTRALVGTDYNRRVSECAKAARRLLDAAGRPTAPALLSEVSEEEYRCHAATLPPPLARRAAHFFGESARVLEGISAWRAGDLRRFGTLMRESGLSSLRNYECGSAPLADLQELLNAQPGVWGARFSGAGFRGSCVALGEPGRLQEAAAAVAAAYAARHPDAARSASFTVCGSGDGAQ